MCSSDLADCKKFANLLQYIDLAMFDLKIIDREKFRKYVGADNKTILKNFEILNESGVEFIARTPLIPDVTDTEENLTAIAEIVSRTRALWVELLPYNKMAGSKYKMLGKTYLPKFDERAEPKPREEIFAAYGVKTKIM